MGGTDNLKNFISKLNDRNLQRKRESGITSYALYAALAFCVYKLYKNLSFYVIKLEIFDSTATIHLTCLMANSLVAVHFFLGAFRNDKKPFSNLKIIKYDNGNFNLLEYLVFLIMYVTPAVFLILSFVYRQSIPILYYVSLGLLNLFTVAFLIHFSFRMKTEIKMYKKKKASELLFLRLVLIVISVLVIFFSIFYSTNIILFEKFIFIKFLALFYLTLFILEKIALQEQSDLHTLNLEDFEYELYLKNLNDEEIRERLQENYVGYLIDQWIAYNSKEVQLFEEEIERQQTIASQQLLDLNKEVDRTKYPIEYDARKNTIYSTISGEVKTKLPKFEKLLSDIEKIKEKEAELTEIELSQLNTLVNHLDKIISTFNRAGVK